jgi:oligoribonuclease NrnB/cAMP/cGMP phosphodiesterase (DHH superfamily)
MKDIIGQSNLVVVLDHHKTAQAELHGLAEECDRERIGQESPTIRFNINKSGARLTWEYFFPDQPSPWLVDYTEDRDLWRHKLPDSKAINAYLRSWPLDFNRWDVFEQIHVNTHDWINCIGAGQSLLRREQQIVDAHVSFAKEMEMDGHKIKAVNATVLSSEIAGELAKGMPFGACYFERKDGKRVWSLRSAPDGVDVSAIAKAHGGGGHKHAAGFEE